MSSILISSGFKHLESLQEFSTRYPCISQHLDDTLNKIWICHKNFEDIPEFEDINSLEHENYQELSGNVNEKLEFAQKFITPQHQLQLSSVFIKIYSHFKYHLTSYIFMNCYMFYNWGVNSFEPVFDQVEIQIKIEKGIKDLLVRNIKETNKETNCGNKFLGEVKSNQNESSLNVERSERERSVDLFDEPIDVHKHQPSKTVSYKSYKTAIEKAEPFVELPRNTNDPSQETFNLNKILYDMKQKSQWPVTHVLSGNDVEKLLLFIVKLHNGPNVHTENKLASQCENWNKLKNLLEIILKKHEAVEKNNGYGRILKRHLKKGKPILGKRLTPIPKSTVLSYILDILRRVLPLELFGRNRLKKKFFSSVVKIVSGSKNENFMWHSLLGFLFENKSDIAWCMELRDALTQNQMILKLFKFIIIHYVFVILKSNFYITETGSSGFGLRFYRKGDVERASSACCDHLLRSKHVLQLSKADSDSYSMERKWVNTGVIDEIDLNRNLKKTMEEGTEFRQAIANLRFLPKNDWSDGMRIITRITRNSSQFAPTGAGLEKTFKARLAWREKKLKLVKLLLQFIVERIEFGIKPVPNNPKLEMAWNKAILLKKNYGKLYFVKTDIENAFGSVRHSVLARIVQDILTEKFTNHSVQLKKITECIKTKGKFWKVSRFSFSDRPRENSVLLTRTICASDDKNLDESNFLDIIRQVAMRQKVEMRGKVLKLVRGLSQGSMGKFSPQLCEIYYSSMDRFYFEDFIDSKTDVFLRAVDDYLLVTPHKEKAERFLKIIRDGIREFNTKFNSEKLKTNLLEDVNEVPYLGLIFNFNDMSVKANYSKLLQKDLQSSMKLSDAHNYNHFNKTHFMESRAMNISGLKLQRILLDKNHNNLRTVRQNVFQACLVQCLRVLTLARYLFPGKTKNVLLLYKVLNKSCRKIKNVVSNGSDVSREDVHWLFFLAALTVFQKFSAQFKCLLVMIRYSLEKCERNFVKNGFELLLQLLKDDLYEVKFWEKVNAMFGKLIANVKHFKSCK